MQSSHGQSARDRNRQVIGGLRETARPSPSSLEKEQAAESRFPSRSLNRAHDRLLPQIIQERIRPEHAAAHSAQIAAGVRDAMRKQIMRIDPAIPRHHLFGYAVGTVKILAPYAVRQSIIRAIHQFDRLCFFAKRNYV